MNLSKHKIGIALHTDIIGDIVERRSQGERNVIERRHASYFFENKINLICDHVIGDTFETLCFPTKKILQGLFPPSYYSPSYLKHNLINLVSFIEDINESSNSALLIRNKKDIEIAINQKRLGIILCFQGCSPLEDEPTLLRAYCNMGVRIINLSSALVPNLAVGHAVENEERGLSNFGKEVLKEAEDLRMIVDLSGCSERGFWDVLKYFSGSVIASTSNCRAIHNRPNNLSDEQIKALSERSGVIGVIFNSRSIGDPTIDVSGDLTPPETNYFYDGQWCDSLILSLLASEFNASS